jgi:hypothetical protein
MAFIHFILDIILKLNAEEKYMLDIVFIY